MSKNRVWQRVLSAEEREEVTQAVYDAYKGPNSERGHAEAGAHFLEAIRDAEQAHRPWAELLAKEWFETGAHEFAKRVWSHRDAFTATVGKVKRQRRGARGVMRTDDAGRADWHQMSIYDLGSAELSAAIKQEEERVEHGRFNVRWMRQLLDLLTETGAPTIRQAVERAGFDSIDEFLDTGTG